jgi:hypothetical protein
MSFGGVGNFDRTCWSAITLSPVAVAANTSAEQTFTVTGLLAADTVIAINKPTAQAGLGIVGFRVSADKTMAITFMNATGSPITPTASQVYYILFGRTEKALNGPDAVTNAAIF